MFFKEDKTKIMDIIKNKGTKKILSDAKLTKNTEKNIQGNMEISSAQISKLSEVWYFDHNSGFSSELIICSLESA